LTNDSKSTLPQVLGSKASEITAAWIELQARSGKRLSVAEVQDNTRVSREFYGALVSSLQSGSQDIGSAPWTSAREILQSFSASRAKGGYTPTETATFIFSLKEPIFTALRGELAGNPVSLADTTMEGSQILDKLGLFTMEAFQRTREDVISRQQQELLELSTPVVRLWENILALPLIGTLDSSRTQVVMQNLLEAIVATRSDFAIIDITGVPVVDTLVAQHLLKTVAAARLMGADCMISGIRPQIAQTIIHLGVDLGEVTTKATLADAFSVALKRGGYRMVKQTDDKRAGAGEK
jgi:rsbT co-antagonist protein RsbR